MPRTTNKILEAARMAKRRDELANFNLGNFSRPRL